jgi:hypothetical protein
MWQTAYQSGKLHGLKWLLEIRQQKDTMKSALVFVVFAAVVTVNLRPAHAGDKAMPRLKLAGCRN